MKQKKTSALTALAIASAVALAACGGGGGGSDSTGAAAPASSPSGGNSPQTSIPPKTSVPPTTFPSTSAQATAFAQINANRLAMGVGEVSQDPVLDTSAAKHATYLTTNLQNGNLTALSHDENPAFPGFFAATPLARADLAGAPATEWIGEVAGSDVLQPDAATTATNCVNGYFDSVYHLQSIAGPQETIGIGFDQNSTLYTCVFDLGQTTGVFGTPVAAGLLQGAGQQMPANAIATWPLPSASGLPAAMKQESPNPAPDLTAPGTPVMVMVNAAAAGDVLTVASFTLTGPGGANVPARIILPAAALTGSTNAATADINNALNAGTAFLLPLAPLSTNTTYTVTFNGARDGTPLSKTWSFTTGAN
jgi:uncharacterized protein YkwD